MHVCPSILTLALCALVAGCSTPQGSPDSGAGMDGSARDTGRLLIDGNGFDVNAPPPPTDAGPLPDTRTPGCRINGTMCSLGTDCCSGSCVGGVCEMQACTADNMACTSSLACCSGMCSSGGTCTPLNSTCSTLGNPCSTGSSCCSGRCAGGVCSAASYCGQNGDSCAVGTDCCGGICTVPSGGTLGVCSQPAGGSSNCSMVDGTVCGSLMAADGGGIPACGGGCCSRLCAPYGPTGVPVCQPASGCHVTGDLCTRDADCCGASTSGVTCSIVAPATVGTCRLPMGCQPDGNICRTATSSCNERCDCCAGNCHGANTCIRDLLGVPRCAGATCVNAGGACSTSANCCNGNPCVPGPSGTFTCYPSACVPTTGSCTTNADCCPGGACILPPGSTSGTCTAPPPPPHDAGPPPPDGTVLPDAWMPDSGVPPTCATFGQLCRTASDCCNGLPCTPGWAGGSRCEPLPM